MKDVKLKLYEYCHQWVDQKISLSRNSIKASQDSANEETKSSAGDKYETGRAMAQLEIENSSMKLAEANKLKMALSQFKGDQLTEVATSGSLVQTNKGWFYISISAGALEIQNLTYICLSPASPLGSAMLGLKNGDKFNFNKQDYVIKAIF